MLTWGAVRLTLLQRLGLALGLALALTGLSYFKTNVTVVRDSCPACEGALVGPSKLVARGWPFAYYRASYYRDGTLAQGSLADNATYLLSLDLVAYLAPLIIVVELTCFNVTRRVR